ERAVPGATLRATSRCDDRRRCNRCRPVDHQEARPDREGHPCRPCRWPFFDRSDKRGLCDRRDRFTGVRSAGVGIDRSRCRRSVAAVRLDPGARLRHGRRQYRQRLADRRSRADADCNGSFGGVASRGAVRTLPLQSFFLDYGKQDRQPGEFVRRLFVPKLSPGTHFRAYKISKRIDEDISALIAACCLKVDAGRISDAKIAFGGMAGIPKRAKTVEGALRGLPLTETRRWQAAADAVGEDFTPLTDVRASAAYRLRVAGNLVIKALAEIAG